MTLSASTREPRAMRFPPIDQVAYVVPDLDTALRQYEALFGPWQVMTTRVDDADFRGNLHSCELKIAYGKSGALEIEFIQPLSGESPQREFIQQGGNGLHHVRYRTDDIERSIAEARALGFVPVWFKRLNAEIAFCYLENAQDRSMIEFLQMP